LAKTQEDKAGQVFHKIFDNAFNLDAMDIRINLENIQTFTDFKRNAEDYLKQIKSTKSPLVLTENGKAEIVVHQAQAFQQMIDKLARLEKEHITKSKRTGYTQSFIILI
jgi:PHD/YefM family antitoxin component YafN of YafNO toxin-antitoxin module